MKNYQITFEAPNGDWTWIDVEAADFHHAILIALDRCGGLRVHSIVFMTPEQAAANAAWRKNREGVQT